MNSQTFDTNRFKKDPNTPIAIALILLSVFIASFFTYDAYYASIEKSNALSELRSQTNEKEKELQALNALKTESSSSGSMAEIERYAGNFREDSLLSNLTASIGNDVTIGNVTIEKWTKLPSGLSLANISVAVQTNTLNDFLSLLDRLSDPNAKRRYFVKSMNIPLDFTTNLPISTTLSLGLYYLK